MSDPEVIGGAVADTITEVIEHAQHEEHIAHETAEQIAAAAMESERGQHIEALERRLYEWESNQQAASEAIAALALGMTDLSARVDLLTQQSLPTPNPQNAVDGQKASQEPEETTVLVVEPEAPPVVPPVPPEPKKKRHRWI